MLIGQTYTEQPHIVVIKDATKLQFLDVGTEIPSDSYENDVRWAYRVRTVGYTRLYGMVSTKAATETVFSGNILLSA